MLLLFAFILCEGADQSVQQQTQVIICILKHVHRHFNVCRISSEYSTTVSSTICSGYIGVGTGGAGPPNNLRGGGQHTLWPPPIIHPSVPAKLFLSILSLNFL